MQDFSLIFSIAVLIISVIAHELSHGYAAEALGDPTARLAGRLTLNPFKHLDPVGSVLVPTLSFYLGGFIFGWAKPVPYNPYNLRGGQYAEAFVASAGVLTNIFLAVFFGLILRFASMGLPVSFVELLSTIVIINLILAIFNLVPIPPLDGSKLLFALLPSHSREVDRLLERFGLLFLILFIFFLWRFFIPLIYSIFTLITGLH